MDPIPAIEDSVEFSLYLNFLGEPQTMSGPMEVGESISVECKEPGNYQIIIIIGKITTWSFQDTHSILKYWILANMYLYPKSLQRLEFCLCANMYLIMKNVYLQCRAGQVEEVFPGWQWRIVNPVTRRQEDPFQPFNTSLPPCGE